MQIYECFCDETRLRIVNLLVCQPLCVCHLQELLGETQVRISKHLAYLKSKGVVHAQRRKNWMIYSLASRRSSELEANLKCLQDCVQTHRIFKKDLRRLAAIRAKVAWLIPDAIGVHTSPKCDIPELQLRPKLEKTIR